MPTPLALPPPEPLCLTGVIDGWVRDRHSEPQREIAAPPVSSESARISGSEAQISQGLIWRPYIVFFWWRGWPGADPEPSLFFQYPKEKQPELSPLVWSGSLDVGHMVADASN